MSTFGGLMTEFPDIRVDYFRPIKDRRPPLACFLSHVHSDHLAGLESLKSPFIYCSAATKEILLRLERYTHRLNFALKILEARKQQYKHLKNLLKPIPLETPTRIELALGNVIQVTLFDANHCTGAVMFLFESEHKAVLYTGDIRSEPWFVNSLTRNPFLIEYTSQLKILDCIYLDTSNTDDVHFPSKAQGLKELIHKVSNYPADTIFHFSAWTFGYEEVWMALSRALKSQIHVDKYKMKLYQSLKGDSPEGGSSGPALAHEGPVLAGYTCGNTPQLGCLTTDTDHSVRVHSCEKDMHCSAINDKTVWIKPIITRLGDGREIGEAGVDGGGGVNLAQYPELQVDSDFDFARLLQIFKNLGFSNIDDIKSVLLKGLQHNVISLNNMGFDREEDETSFSRLAKTLSNLISENQSAANTISSDAKAKEKGLAQDTKFASVITFPYSRHSSYPELVDLVGAFRPKDVYPCTFDESDWRRRGISMKSLFGNKCSAEIFRHDIEIYAGEEAHLASQNTRITTSPPISQTPSPISASPSISMPRIGLRDESKYDSLGRRTTANLKGTETILRSSPLNVTPSPRVLFDVSPGSESQSLRRKAVHDCLDRGNSKRLRLGLAGFNSLPLAKRGSNRATGTEPLDIALRSSVTGDGQTDKEQNDEDDKLAPYSDSEVSLAYSNDWHTSPTGGLDLGWHWDFKTRNKLLASPFQHQNGQEISFKSEQHGGGEIYMEKYTYKDRTDNVLRCKLCSHEVWSQHLGFCTGCVIGQSGWPYFEFLDPSSKGRPEFELNDPNDPTLGAEESRPILPRDSEPYLDCDSSAYDSQDCDPEFSEEYEINSFVNNSSEGELCDNSDNESSSDGEVEYKEKYKTLAINHASLVMRHDVLQRDYIGMKENFNDLRRRLISSEFDEGEEDMDSIDEAAVHVINAPTADPLLAGTELSAGEQSKKPGVSPVRNSALSHLHATLD